MTDRRRGWLRRALLRLGFLTVLAACAWGVHEVATVGVAHAAESSPVTRSETPIDQLTGLARDLPALRVGAVAPGDRKGDTHRPPVTIAPPRRPSHAPPAPEPPARKPSEQPKRTPPDRPEPHQPADRPEQPVPPQKPDHATPSRDGDGHPVAPPVVGHPVAPPEAGPGHVDLPREPAVPRSDGPPSVPDDEPDVAKVAAQLTNDLGRDRSVYRVVAHWLASEQIAAHADPTGYFPGQAPLSPGPASSGVDSTPCLHSNTADAGPAAWAPPPVRSQLTRPTRTKRRQSRSPRPRSRPA
ncbi:hypothetical protein AB0M35_20525 [Micromonospora sp. NPDC051196]|uniref:hypothetical protein n=1 Tax=Micromonospora sp. NPDC051196 TaxID=3155281 RepID=UPI00343122C7